jgi:hypothetical protein
MDHTHSWEPYSLKPAWDYGASAIARGIRSTLIGRVTKCQCGVMMFFPHKKELSAVEVAIEKEI